MPLAKGLVEAGLSAKGFELTNSHHRLFRYVTRSGCRTIIKTFTSHGRGGKTIGNRLIGRMARQCHLSTRNFEELVSCNLSQDDYECLLRTRGLLEADE